MSERRAQIQSAHKLSKARRCELLGLARYFEFYNARRRHSALDRRAPDAVYYAQVSPAAAA